MRALRATDWVVLAACVAGPPFLYTAFRTVRFEDAYFFFQTARNLAHGDGYAFNPGERVFAATSPLYTFVVSALYLLSPGAIETSVIALNACLVSAQALFLYLLLRDRLPITGSVLALLAAIDGYGIYRYISMETSLYTALVLGALWAMARRGAWLTGTLIGVATLCRYDAILLWPLYVAWSFATCRNVDWRALGIAALVVLPWLVFASVYFGSPLPHTLGAKSSVVGYAEYMYDSLGSLTLLHAVTPNMPVLALIFGSCAGLAGFWLLRGPGMSLLPLVVYALALRAGYAFIGPPSGENWHLYVSNLGIGALLVLGSVGSIERLTQGKSRPWAVAVPAALGTAWLIMASLSTVQHRALIATDFWLGPRAAIYHDVSAWLGAHVKPGRRMMSTEVATLGYLTGHRMVDPLGLINPTNDYPRTHKRSSHLALVRRYRPDLLLVDWPDYGAWLERRTAYRMVKVFEWRNPFSTLLVARSDELKDPARFSELHAQALAASEGASIHYRGE